MAVERVVIPYTPRPQFEPYHARTERFAKIVAHRRFGKTVGCINDMVKAALTVETKGRASNPPKFSYIAPTYTQAKDVVWGYLKYYSSPIPGIDIRESELSVEYPNGARVRLYGADNYDRLRGLYNDGVILDEPAQIDPKAWPEVILPTLSDHSGWATFIGTPAGRDWFYRIDRNDAGEEFPDWFRLTLKASQTGIIPPEELVALRANMSEAQYEREFECSFDAAIEGAYYAQMLADAKSQGRIGRVAADPLLPVRAFHDIGGAGQYSDAYAIWIAQWIGQEIRVLDYYESRGQVLAHHVNWMRSRGWGNAVNYLHDGVQPDKIQGKRFEDHWREAGFSVEPSVKNQGRGAAMMRVEALRRLGNRIWWNDGPTAPGREALVHYHEKIDERRNVGLGPEHDWTSHAADSIGMMAMCYVEPASSSAFNRPIQYANAGWR